MNAKTHATGFSTVPEAQKDFTSSGLIPAIAICLIVAALAMAVFREGETDDPRRAARAPVMTEYEPSWHRGASTDITKTLLAHHVDDCGELAWRPHRTLHGQYVAYCSADARRWTAWVVDTSAHKIRGPFQPDPLTPLPQ